MTITGREFMNFNSYLLHAFGYSNITVCDWIHIPMDRGKYSQNQDSRRRFKASYTAIHSPFNQLLHPLL